MKERDGREIEKAKNREGDGGLGKENERERLITRVKVLRIIRSLSLNKFEMTQTHTIIILFFKFLHCLLLIQEGFI